MTPARVAWSAFAVTVYGLLLAALLLGIVFGLLAYWVFG